MIFFLIAVCPVAASATTLPDVSAQGAALLQTDSGALIYQKNADVRLPMASTTKIMTAIVAMEHADPSTQVTIPPQAVGIEGSSIYLYEGECLCMEHLLYALLLESANDAAVAIAIATAGSVETFVAWMNQKAVELGLQNTHFTNPHGLDHAQHYTTAADLARLAAYCMQEPLFRTIVSTQRMTIPLHDVKDARLLLNHNRLLRAYDGAIGIKTGFTKRSGRCLVSAAERDGVELIAVTLNAPDDWDDHRQMLDYGFSCLEGVSLHAPYAFSYSLPVVGGTPHTTVTLSSPEAVFRVLPRTHGQITCRCEAPRWVAHTVHQGDVLGQLSWYCDGDLLARVPLIAQQTVKVAAPHSSLWRRLISFFHQIIKSE